ncbi:MAG: TrkH family potassium uptake protein [Hyphomicrobiaceae bacterium]|nr:TrkH family potassium uptake protein [Hyphomicrobiaceae bacterium]
MNRAHLRTAAFVSAFFAAHLSAAMLLPAIADLFQGNDDWKVFLASAMVIGFLSVLIMLATRGPAPSFTPRFGFLIVNCLWLSATLVGALPFYLSTLHPGIVDSLFESMSGLTTTGSTVFTGLEHLPHGILLWRALLQWLGGIGILAMGLLLLPLLEIGGHQLFRIESSDKADKPLPRMRQVMALLIQFYLVTTATCFGAYAALGMDWFDAVVHAFTTVSTGGYSTTDASFGAFTGKPALLWAGTLFMLLAALPFFMFLKAFTARPTKEILDPQVVPFLGAFVFATFFVALGLELESGTSFANALTLSAFNVASIITTTGYAAEDYTLWGPLAVGVFFGLTFLGGCAGSTSGGLKTYRLVIIFKAVVSALQKLIYPHGVHRMTLAGRSVDAGVVHSVLIFLAAYILILCALTLAVAATGEDLVTAFTGVLTALNNVGPGFGNIIGPASTFADLNSPAKLILCAAMLLGRLEILTVLVLLVPRFWRG